MLLVKFGWCCVVGLCEIWVFVIVKFLIDLVWWLFLFWLFDFLYCCYGLDLCSFGLLLVVIYLLFDFGSVVGGWLLLWMMCVGFIVNCVWKIMMLICVIVVMLVFVV